jgi:hypothetical protein
MITRYGITGGLSESERRVGEKVMVNGLLVSTAWSLDCGYETALADLHRWHVVEYYDSLEEAINGHEKWIKKAETIVKVDSYYDKKIYKKNVILNRSV